MSIAHLRYRFLGEQLNSGRIFAVETPDFNVARKWTEIGKVEIFQNSNNFKFSPSTDCPCDFLDPAVYGLSTEERESIINKSTKSFGLWSMAIFHYAQALSKIQHPPEIYPKIYRYE